MRKRGYLVPDEVLPSIPKKITQGSVRRLKTITPKVLYEQSEYIEQSTGEIIEGKRGRFYEREIASAKANATKQKNKLAEVIADGKIDLSDFVNLTDLIETPIADTYEDYQSIEDYYTDENNWNDYSDINVDPIERIRDRIQTLPTIFYATMNGYRVTLDKRDAFLRINEIFEQRVSEFGDNFQEVVDYCNSIVSEIDSIADDIMQSSDIDHINTQYARLMELIKGIPLSKEEREYAGEITDSTDDWEDEDYNEW